VFIDVVCLQDFTETPPTLVKLFFAVGENLFALVDDLIYGVVTFYYIWSSWVCILFRGVRSMVFGVDFGVEENDLIGIAAFLNFNY
jgi:hypothetical protein